MKIKQITIQKKDINNTNVCMGSYSYGSVVNNDTGSTPAELINTAALVLFDMYKHQKGANSDEENT
ncbi:hypothetical protein [Ruminococcus flavefaciens]|uniref:hypothetical protein n=1 Tax=Ruminococcus flavefaciens TaxID=1265 RepID=UPI001564A77D|nr:hypothetical protein [Ruminococcus flavefaciens]